MLFTIPYGENVCTFTLPDDNIWQVLNLPETVEIQNVKDYVKEKVRHPLGTTGLAELVKQRKPKKIAVIVEDITRPNPDYVNIIEPIIDEFLSTGIRTEQINFVIAHGTHRKHRDNENIKLYGNRLTSQFTFIAHDCDAADLVSYGKLSTGNELWINRYVADADFVIAVGNIEPHTFAGFTGGRKAILPGVSGRDTCTRNHAQVVRPGVDMGELANNSVHLEMMEAAEKVGLDFIVNLIRNAKKRVVEVVAGHWRDAFNAGIEIALKVYAVKINRLADVAIAGCGGYPKDLNFYQAQKIVTVCNRIVKDGGTIVVLAECRDGVGQAVFGRWLKEANTVDDILHKQEQEIEVEGHRAYLTAKVLKRCRVVVYSTLAKTELEKLHFCNTENIELLINDFVQHYGPDFGCYILPNASTILPIYE